MSVLWSTGLLRMGSFVFVKKKRAGDYLYPTLLPPSPIPPPEMLPENRRKWKNHLGKIKRTKKLFVITNPPISPFLVLFSTLVILRLSRVVG